MSKQDTLKSNTKNINTQVYIYFYYLSLLILMNASTRQQKLLKLDYQLFSCKFIIPSTQKLCSKLAT